MHPFRFGVMSTGRPDGWAHFARRVEDLGYDVLQVAQHFSLRSVPPLPAVALAAAATSTLQVGTLVLDNETTHPAVVARDAAWLAAETDGRFELGIGAGWLGTDHTVVGAPWRCPADRVARLDEALSLIRACWAGEPTTFTGTHYRVDGLANGSVTPAPPRILVGGGGPRLLAVAARHADIVGIAPDMRSGRIGGAAARTVAPDQVATKIERVRALTAERVQPVVLHVALTAVLDRAATSRIEKTAAAFGLPPEEIDDVPSVLVGSTAEIVERLRERRERLGFSYVSVPESALDRLAPVVAELAGT
ncbi:TIGR03621 family F420-dependent LLM class oxidoreductase [Pseudonocardia halophobica]|uniref:TIGR03621 family F420-dependent LLM class oxidoreductase n=1 Tax=Pseudonocardia halophobica TaxID=29401 RepID=UPI003D902987